jgi:hypothetical protein
MLTLLFREQWFYYSQSVERLFKGLPCETLALPSSPIEPFEGTFYRPVVELHERFHVAPYNASLPPSRTKGRAHSVNIRLPGSAI